MVIRQPAKIATIVIFAGMGVGLAGCSQQSLMNTAGTATTTSASTADSQKSAYAAPKNKKEENTFNPFRDPSDAAPGGRVVIANPSQADIMKTGALPEMAFGKQNAPVTIIKYASLTCRYCRKFHLETFPQLKRDYIDTGKVRFIIREFPIGRSSGNATIALRCAPPEKYLTLYGKFLAHQETWVSQEVRLDKIHKVAQQVGLTRQKFDACLENQDMIAGLRWIKDRGRTLGVIGTPNFFIGGKLVKSFMDYSQLRARIDPLLGANVTSASN